MKKITAVLLIFCLLLTTGCAGSNSGAVPQNKELDIKEISVDSAEYSYAVENLELPQNVWFSQSNIVSIEKKIYLLGNFLESNYLFSINSDGSEAKLLASCEDGSEQWYAYCTMGGKLYVLDSISNQLIEFTPDGTKLRYISLPEGTTATGMAGGKETIFVLNSGKVSALKIGEKSEAELAYTISASDSASIGQSSDGSVFVAWLDGETQAISTIDEENRGWGKTCYLDSYCRIIGIGTKWELYLQIDAALYGFNFSTETIKKLLAFSDSGLLSNGVVYEVEEGKLIYTGTSSNEVSPLLMLKPVNVTEENEKVTMATLVELPYLIKEAVLTWNQEHPECQIEIKDYSQYTTDENSRGAELQLMMDIASGNIPDLYNLSDYYGEILNAALLVRKNLLEDLYPYIDSDQELSRDDFFSGPLSALEINGGLYQIVPGFMLLTTSAATQDVGAPENWTYDRLERVVAKNDYYQYLFDTEYSRDEWLRLMVSASGERLVDWTHAQCFFDSEYFVRLLKIAANRPEEIDITGTYVDERIQNSHALLYMLFIRNVYEAEIVADAYGDGKYAFVGLPEIGSVLAPELSIGMSFQSAHKEQCWQFLREFLLRDNAYTYYLPLRRDVARQQMQNEVEALKENDDEYASRERAMEALLSELENTDSLYGIDTQLWSVIQDEVNKFYAGRCTAEETAKAIQSRAKIYIAEQS